MIRYDLIETSDLTRKINRSNQAKTFVRIICTLKANNDAVSAKHPYIYISFQFGLTGDSDGDAFEDGVEAEGSYEQDAVAEGAGVA